MAKIWRGLNPGRCSFDHWAKRVVPGLNIWQSRSSSYQPIPFEKKTYNQQIRPFQGWILAIWLPHDFNFEEVSSFYQMQMQSFLKRTYFPNSLSFAEQKSKVREGRFEPKVYTNGLLRDRNVSLQYFFDCTLVPLESPAARTIKVVPRARKRNWFHFCAQSTRTVEDELILQLQGLIKNTIRDGGSTAIDRIVFQV